MRLPRRARTSRAWSARTSRAPAGRARRRGRQPCAANSRAGRSAPRPRSRVGVVGEVLPRRRRAPLLAHEQHRRERAGQQQRRAARQQPGRAGRASRSPVARLPTWSWVCSETTNRSPAYAPGRPGARACAAGTSSTCRRGRTPCSSTLVERAGVVEVGVVALRLAGQQRRAGRGGRRRPTARASPRPPASRGGDGQRVVAVGLGDQRQRPAEPRDERARPRPTAPPASDRPVVEQRVHGVEAQPVDVEVAQPHQRVVDDEAPHLVAAGAVEVDGAAPHGVR